MGEMVRLELARRGFFSGGGFSGSFTAITVKVKNIAFTKDVEVQYTPDGHNWKDFALPHSFFAVDHDIFEGTVNEQRTGRVVTLRSVLLLRREQQVSNQGLAP